MANAFDSAFNSLRTAFQTVTGSTPTMNVGSQTVNIIPGEVGVAPMFFDGGTGNSDTLTIQTRASDWTGGVPVKLQVATIAGHSSAPSGTYQILSTTHRDGTVSFTLGNIDAQ